MKVSSDFEASILGAWGGGFDKSPVLGVLLTELRVQSRGLTGEEMEFLAGRAGIILGETSEPETLFRRLEKEI